MLILLIGSLGLIGNHSEKSFPIENQAGMPIVNSGTGIPDRTKSILGSHAKHSFEEMCKWSWYRQEQRQESNSLGH
jgi:hypothetical protein